MMNDVDVIKFLVWQTHSVTLKVDLSKILFCCLMTRLLEWAVICYDVGIMISFCAWMDDNFWLSFIHLAEKPKSRAC